MILRPPVDFDKTAPQAPTNADACELLFVGCLRKFGAEGRTRTDTRLTPQQILSLPRLPVPPLRLNRDTSGSLPARPNDNGRGFEGKALQRFPVATALATEDATEGEAGEVSSADQGVVALRLTQSDLLRLASEFRVEIAQS